MIKHILIPTDGSELSIDAARQAGDIARGLNARVTVFSVLDDEAIVAAAWGMAEGSYSGPGGDISIEMTRQRMEEQATGHVLPKTAAAVGDLDPAPELVHAWGRTASEICDYAEKNAVDLIVMGSHGRTGIKAMLLGSVSNAVVNRAPCSVMIVR